MPRQIVTKHEYTCGKHNAHGNICTLCSALDCMWVVYAEKSIHYHRGRVDSITAIPPESTNVSKEDVVGLFTMCYFSNKEVPGIQWENFVPSRCHATFDARVIL